MTTDVDDGQNTAGEKTILTYDFHRNLTSKEIYDLSQGEWKLVDGHRYEYTYDEHDSITLKTCLFWEYVHWVDAGQSKYERTYDGHNNPTSKTSYYMNENGQWILESAVEWTYDSADNIIEDCTSRESEDGIHKFKYTYTYDAQGNRTSSESCYWTNSEGGEQWKPIERLEYSFDPQGNMTHDSNFSWENNGWNLGGYRIYYYSTQSVIEQIKASHRGIVRKVLKNDRLRIENNAHTYDIMGRVM